MLHMPSPMMMANADVPPGQILFTPAGSSGSISDQPWVVPAGVTSISVVAIGAGCGRTDWTGAGGGGWSGAGGGLAYVNALSVTPGETLFVTVLGEGGYSRLARAATDLCRASAAKQRIENDPTRGAPVVGTGFSGGSGQYSGADTGSGGGAGGYTSGGGSGGTNSRGGRGVSPLGGGAGGTAGGNTTSDGGLYGGGSAGNSSSGGKGCLRITWGAGRAFPNTKTGDL